MSRVRSAWRASTLGGSTGVVLLLLTLSTIGCDRSHSTSTPHEAAGEGGTQASLSPDDEAADPVARAERRFDAGLYAEGRKILLDAVAASRGDPVASSDALLALATFYERYVGDFRRADSALRQVERARLPSDHPNRQTALRMRAQIRQLAAEYGDVEAAVARAAAHQTDDEALRQRVDELEAITASRAEYPGIATVWHYLGQCQLALGDFRAAHGSYTKALALRPAIDFALPTGRQQAEAFDRWVRRDLSRASRALLATMAVALALLLGRTRPWRWLGARHALALALLVGAWWIGVRLLVAWLADGVPSDLSSLPGPVYLQTGLSTPLSAPLHELSRYGIVGIVGVFVIATWTSRLRLRWTALTAGALTSALWVACLMVQFVLAQQMASFQPASAGRFRFLRGAFLYPMSQGQEPFILTDPMRYCAFQTTIDEMDEEEPKRWFRRYAERCNEP